MSATKALTRSRKRGARSVVERPSSPGSRSYGSSPRNEPAKGVYAKGDEVASIIGRSRNISDLMLINIRRARPINPARSS